MESEGHNTKSSDAKFDSYDIGRKEKVDYFSKNQPKPRKKIRDWKIFKGKNKFILLGVVLAIILVPIIISGLVYYFSTYLPEKTSNLTPEEQAFVEESLDIYNEANKLAGNDANNIALVMAYLNDEADRLDDVNEKFVVRTIITDFYWKFGMNEEALNFLNSLDASGLNTERTTDLYNLFAYAYEQLGDPSKAQEYRIKGYELMGMPAEMYNEVNMQEGQISDEEMEDIINGR